MKTLIFTVVTLLFLNAYSLEQPNRCQKLSPRIVTCKYGVDFGFNVFEGVFDEPVERGQIQRRPYLSEFGLTSVAIVSNVKLLGIEFPECISFSTSNTEKKTYEIYIDCENSRKP